MHEPDEALELALNARKLSDLSGDWLERYWVNRLIADLDFHRGDYQGGLVALRDAHGISESANQPLNSAWVNLQISAALMALGEWQGALDSVNAALPILQQFSDTDDEIAAYGELIDIYGERESDIKDFDKALQFYESAKQLLLPDDLGHAATLAMDVEEIYWQQGRYREAIASAQEALLYYRSQKDIGNEANTLLSLAEAERSSGDLQVATTSLAQAEPLVKQSDDFYLTGRFYYGEANVYKSEGRLQDAIDQYEHVISFLEEYKANSDINSQRKLADNYNYIYGELIDSYYLFGAAHDASRTSSAEKALEYAELNKARIFTNAWGNSFVDALGRKLPADLQDKERDVLARQESLHSELSQLASIKSGRTVKQIQADLQQCENGESLLRDKLRKVVLPMRRFDIRDQSRSRIFRLRPGEVLIEFKMFDPALFVWILQGSESGTKLDCLLQGRP